MKLVFLATTKRDIAWFRKYYQTVFPEGASQAQQQFLNFKDMLKGNPHIGHPSSVIEQACELHIARTPFTIVYRVTDAHIEVLRIWDERQVEDF